MPFECQSLLNAVFNDAPQAILVTDERRRIVSVNRAFEHLFGYRGEDLQGRTPQFLRQTPADVSAQLEPPALLQPGQPTPVWFWRKDGSPLIAATSVTPVHDDSGQTVGYAMSLLDVTDRVRFRDMLEQIIALTNNPRHDFESCMAILLQLGCDYYGAEVGILSCIEGSDYTIEAVVSDQLALSVGQRFVLSDTYCELVFRRDSPVAFHHAARSDFAAHPCYRAMQLECYIGAPVMVAGKPFGTLNFSHRQPRTQGFSTDEIDVVRLLAEWVGRRLEERARQNELKLVHGLLAERGATYHGLYRRTPAMMFSTDQNDCLVDVNDEWLQVMGYTRDEVLGRESVSFLSAEASEYASEEVLPALHSTGNCHKVPCQMVKKDGSILDVELSAIIDHEQPGTEPRVFGVCIDVTDRNLAVATLRQRHRELAAANDDLEQFAYIASHDLREPLRKIRTFISYLVEDLGSGLSDDDEYHMKVIVNAAGRMDRLITDLLAFSRTGRAAANATTVNLGQLVREVLADLSVQIEAIDGQVRVDPLPSIHADAALLRILMQNLLANAVRYASDARPLHIHVGCNLSALGSGSARDIELFVRDNGIGFEPKFEQHIFAPFKRLHAQSQYEGTGIGLAICQKIAGLHDGRISASGEPDVGACFTLQVPGERLRVEMERASGV